ncbi:MAG: hypothetical protein H7Y28_16680 [Rhodoferax sp.]|nr:hypothetical protein [Rhodoferax sp.]
MLVLALVLAQSIGLIHGIAHAPLLSNTHVEHAGDAPNSFAERLFGDHQDQNGNVKCHLFDQCNHLDGLCDVHSVLLPTQLVTVIAVAFTGLFAVRWLTAFHARGPPSLR